MGWFKKSASTERNGRFPDDPPEVRGAGDSSEHRRVVDMLILMCEGNYQAMVTNTELGASWVGRFARTENETVFLEVQLNEVEALLDPGAFCTVSFTYENHAQVFLTTVKQSSLMEDKGLAIELFVPDAIHAAGRRELYRVPVLIDTEMEARVTASSGAVFSARVQDINTSGVRIRPNQEAMSFVGIGEQIELLLTLGELTAHRAADVRHKDLRNSAFGLHFLETTDTVKQQQIRLIVREAERRYLLRINRLD